ncbi:MAG TPA: prepilin-type N-terminal cleavage/methylation domain-containing protein [Gemmatimonadales bacterium]|nr:prepilin-type N-terminal cleavage/methylation domain-containing protein [Gemmatimonadales bacterium]
MSSNRSGFTLVEVVMAIVILSFGIVVLASTAAGISRMLDSGQGKTRAAALAASRVELLRNVAAGTTPPCGSSALASGSAVAPGGFSEEWTVSGTGADRQIQVIVRYRNGTRPQADTLFALLLC